MSTVITGGCLCGNIRFAYKGVLGTAAYCHCSDCRKCTGSAFSVSVAMEIEHFEITAGSLKGFAKKGDSGNDLTHLFLRLLLDARHELGRVDKAQRNEQPD